MKIYTIGFTKKSAEKFFGLLCKVGVGTLVDVRLNNVSQLAGFAGEEEAAVGPDIWLVEALPVHTASPVLSQVMERGGSVRVSLEYLH